MPVRPHPAAVTAARSVLRRLAALALVVVPGVVVGPGVVVVPAAAIAAPASATVPPTDTTNPYLPEGVNIGDCLSSMPRPDCGSQARGGVAQWSVLVVLVGGLAFIGWRVVRGARRNAASAAARLGQDTPPDRSPAS